MTDQAFVRKAKSSVLVVRPSDGPFIVKLNIVRWQKFSLGSHPEKFAGLRIIGIPSGGLFYFTNLELCGS